MAEKKSTEYAKDYTKPKLREQLKEQIKQGSKGGEAGHWSARKSQLLKHEYEKNGGDYKHKGTLTSEQKHLKQWSKKDS